MRRLPCRSEDQRIISSRTLAGRLHIGASGFGSDRVRCRVTLAESDVRSGRVIYLGVVVLGALRMAFAT